MKVSRLEAHDRYQHFLEDQAQKMFEGVNDCIYKNSLSLQLQEYSPYIYIFAHPRTGDDGVTKRMLWQPRLTRPDPQTNSYLFRVKSKSDLCEICWLLPPRELWGQYRKGNVCESDTVAWSIHMFQNRREELARPFPEDMSDNQIAKIYAKMASDKVKPKNGEASPIGSSKVVPFPSHLES